MLLKCRKCALIGCSTNQCQQCHVIWIKLKKNEEASSYHQVVGLWKLFLSQSHFLPVFFSQLLIAYFFRFQFRILFSIHAVRSPLKPGGVLVQIFHFIGSTFLLLAPLWILSTQNSPSGISKGYASQNARRSLAWKWIANPRGVGIQGPILPLWLLHVHIV